MSVSSSTSETVSVSTSIAASPQEIVFHNYDRVVSSAPLHAESHPSLRESLAPLTRANSAFRAPEHTFECNFAIRVGEEFQATVIPSTQDRQALLQQYYNSRAQQVEGTRLWRGSEAEGIAKHFLRDLKTIFDSKTKSETVQIDVEKSLYLLDQFNCDSVQALNALFPISSRSRAAAAHARAKMMNGEGNNNYEAPKTRSQTSTASPKKERSPKVNTPTLPPSEEEVAVDAENENDDSSNPEENSPSSKENSRQAEFQKGWALVYQLTGYDIMKALAVNDEVCFCCKDGGDIICCDKPGCRRSFHLLCHGLNEVPKGSTWFCKAHSCFECHKNLERDAHIKPCIICSKASCAKHRSKFLQKKGYVVRDICEHCASLTETDSDFFEWHLFSLHRILQHQEVSIDFKIKDGTKLNHLELYKATLNLQDTELNNMNIWRIIADSFKVDSAVQLQQHYIRVLLPYKKLYFDSIRYSKNIKSKNKSGKLSRESSGSSTKVSNKKRKVPETELTELSSPKRPGLRSHARMKP